MSIINDLNWRHALKAYDSEKKVSTTDLQRILEAMRLAPTSSGLQPFHVFVISSSEAKEKLASTCSTFLKNERYVLQSSCTLLVAGWDNYTEQRIKDVYNQITLERGLPQGRYDKYVDSLIQMYMHHNTERDNFEHISRQAYIAIGMGLAEAATLRIGSTPIEGFDNQAADKLFNLPQAGYKSLCLITLGHADEEKDWNNQYPKVRRHMQDFVTEL